MINEDEIEILYNINCGGWGISKKAIELYNLRISHNLSEFGKDVCCRNDPILIQIYKELGDDFNDMLSKIQIKKILKKYENYYYIEEYDDGKEYVKIDYSKYKLDNVYTKIKEILQSNNDNNTKINKIKHFIMMAS